MPHQLHAIWDHTVKTDNIIDVYIVNWGNSDIYNLDNRQWAQHIDGAAYVPASMTAWILSLGPSVRYERAQQASDRTSRSEWWMSRASAGRHWHTASNGGGGFLLRQRFDSVHVTLRRNETDVSALMWCSRGSRQPQLSTWSRRSGPSPV